jgi:hypothetical protein
MPPTTMAQRQEMVRPIMHRVRVAADGRSERRRMTIAWGGGGRTAGLTTPPINHMAHLSDSPRWCERIRTLVHEGDSTVQITTLLVQAGFCAPKHARPCSRHSGIALMRRVGVHQPRRRRPPVPEHEWWLSDVEREVGRSNATRHQWRKRGWRQARWPDHRTRWVAWADEAELPRLTQRGALPTGEASRQGGLDAHRSQPTVSPRFTAISYPQRRYVRPSDHDKPCLHDNIMVDTSNAPSPGWDSSAA